MEGPGTAQRLLPQSENASGRWLCWSLSSQPIPLQSQHAHQGRLFPLSRSEGIVRMTTVLPHSALGKGDAVGARGAMGAVPAWQEPSLCCPVPTSICPSVHPSVTQHSSRADLSVTHCHPFHTQYANQSHHLPGTCSRPRLLLG